MRAATIITEKAPLPVGAYSQAVKAGGLVFVSGQIPIDPSTGELVSGTFEEQVEQVFENIEAILVAGDGSLERIAKLTVFLADLDKFASLNSAMESIFKHNLPAREVVEVSRLPRGAEVEISAIGFAGD